LKVTEPKKNQREPEKKKDVKVSHVPVKQKGLRVIARNDDDGFYYPGLMPLFISAINSIAVLSVIPVVSGNISKRLYITSAILRRYFSCFMCVNLGFENVDYVRIIG
jgi:hypothetical protein